ncbi:MAG: LysM peptidoglycan-binding domain-containing protein [Planctomycetes bacterium]|nr:LysM peptidoglycan-binding domain-containing protein [Planctomycetota bacterium]
MTLRTKLAVVGTVLVAGTVAALCFRKPATETQTPAQSTATLPLRDRDAVASATAGVSASAASQGVPLPAVAGTNSLGTVGSPLPGDLNSSAKLRLTPPRLPPGFTSKAQDADSGAKTVPESPQSPPPLPDLRGNVRQTPPLSPVPRPAPEIASNIPRAVDRPAPPAERPGPWRSHTVVDGDTLSTLATRYLGSSGRFAEILEANRNQLRSADMLPIGTVLRIPPQSAPAASAASLPAEDLSRFPHLVPIPAGALTSRESSR